MGAQVCYNDKIVSSEDQLYFWFECKVCRERWMSSFCFCPKCNRVNKFKILSGEQAYMMMKSNAVINDFLNMAIYGLLNEEYK